MDDWGQYMHMTQEVIQKLNQIEQNFRNATFVQKDEYELLTRCLQEVEANPRPHPVEAFSRAFVQQFPIHILQNPERQSLKEVGQLGLITEILVFLFRRELNLTDDWEARYRTLQQALIRLDTPLLISTSVDQCMTQSVEQVVNHLQEFGSVNSLPALQVLIREFPDMLGANRSVAAAGAAAAPHTRR